jgi:peptide/nickel transport system permease protein
MGRYLLRRVVVVFLPTLFVISVVVFFVIHLIPGSYVDVLLGTSADVSEEQIAQIYRKYGLDQPLLVQYLRWLENLLQGDLGISLRTHQPVVSEILNRLPVTLELALLALLFSLVLAIPIGMVAAIRQNTVIDAAARLFGLLGLSIPNFLLGTLLILFVSLYLPIFPTTGYVPLSEGLWANLRTIILPSFALGLFMTASTMRMVRSSMLEEIRKEYTTVARGKGLAEMTVMSRHVLRNALLPVVTTVGIQIGYLLGGTVIIEELFALPGIGRLGLYAIYTRDYPLVQGVVLFMAFAFVSVNLIADLTYGWLDPRIRKAQD